MSTKELQCVKQNATSHVVIKERNKLINFKDFSKFLIVWHDLKEESIIYQDVIQNCRIL